MAQWKSQIRKMNNHYQSESGGGGVVYINKDVGSFNLITIKDKIYLTPMGYKISNAVELPSYTTNDGTARIWKNGFDFSKMKKYNTIGQNFGSKKVFHGIYDYGTFKPEPLAGELYANRPYEIGSVASTAGQIPKGSEPVYFDLIIPTVHMIPMMFAWIESGFESLLPSWVQSIPVIGDYVPEDIDPTQTYNTVVDASNLIRAGLTESYNLYTSPFTSSLKIPVKALKEDVNVYNDPGFASASPSLMFFNNNPNQNLPPKTDDAPETFPGFENYISFEGETEYVSGGTFGKVNHGILGIGAYVSPSPISFVYNETDGSVNETIYNKSFTLTYKTGVNFKDYNFNCMFKRFFDSNNNQVGAIYFTVANNIDSISFENGLFATRI